MDFFNEDWYKKGLDFQKNMMDRYMETISNFGKMAESSKDKSWQDAWQENMKKWTDFYSDAFKPDKNFFSKNFFGFPPVADPSTWSDMAKMYGRFSDSMSVYMKLHSLWVDFVGELTDDPEDMPEIIKEYMEKSGKVMGEMAKNMVRPFVPEDVFSIMESYQEFSNTAGGVLNDFLAPWADKRDDMTEYFNKAMAGDLKSSGKYISLLSEAYQESFGKMFRASGVSIMKDKVELNFKTFDSYVNLLLSYFEMMASVQTILGEANKELWEEIGKMMEDSEKNPTFKDFYDMWIKINSKFINDFYFTDEFSAFMGKFADNASDFKVKYDEFMESMLSSFPVPTNSEMKSVYKTVYDLRKDVRSLKKELKEVRKELKELKEDMEA